MQDGLRQHFRTFAPRYCELDRKLEEINQECKDEFLKNQKLHGNVVNTLAGFKVDVEAGISRHTMSQSKSTIDTKSIESKLDARGQAQTERLKISK